MSATNPTPPESWKTKLVPAVIGAVIGGAMAWGAAYFTYVYVQAPQLELTRQQLRDAEAKEQREAAEKAAALARAQQAEAQAAAARAQLADAARQWGEASNRFVGRMTDNIRLTLADPRIFEGRPHPSPREFAQRLVEERDAARAATLETQRQVGADMSDIYAALNGEIDALQTLLANPRSSEEAIKAQVAKIQSGWAAKVALINRLALQSMQRTGCPITLASSPGRNP